MQMPWEEMFLTCSSNGKEVSMAGVQWAKGEWLEMNKGQIVQSLAYHHKDIGFYA